MSNNEQWSRELENLLSGYVNELLRNTLNPVPPISQTPQPAHQPVETVDPVGRYYTLLHDYNANIRLYQENIRDLIQCLNREPSSIGRNTSIPPGTNIPITQPPITTTLFSYILQPLPSNATAESVGLTSQQIQSATTNIPYREDMNETRCPICLEDFEIGEPVCKIIACGHFFKRQSLLNWFSRNSHCPVCRGNVLHPQTPVDNRPVDAETPANNPSVTTPPLFTRTNQTTRRLFGAEPPSEQAMRETPGVPLFTPNRLLQSALLNLQSPVMDEVNTFLRNLGNTDASFNEVD